MKSRDLATAGILIALQTVTLLLIYVIPTIKLALLFAAALYPGVMLRIGVKKTTIAISYITSSALVLFLLGAADVAVLYIIFFGWYCLLHEATKSFSAVKKQAIRFAGFAASGGALYLIYTYLIAIQIVYASWIYALVGTAMFIIMQIIYEVSVKEVIKLTGINLVDDKIIFKK